MPTPDLNPTPPTPSPMNYLAGVLSFLESLAGKRTIILSGVLAITKAILPFVPAGSAVAAVLNLLDQFIPVLIPITLHQAIVNNGTQTPNTPAAS